MRFTLFPLVKIVCLIVAVFSFTPTQVHAEEYRYDDFGRLIEVTYDNGTRIVYVYDNAGNRKEKHIEKIPAEQNSAS